MVASQHWVESLGADPAEQDAAMSFSDWLRVDCDLLRKPEVFAIARNCRTSRYAVVGHLVALWGWADAHSTDGQHLAVTGDEVDVLVECPGIAAALRSAGWLDGVDGDLSIPRFDKHNGRSAKARSLEREAKRLRRMSDDGGGEVSDNCPTELPGFVGPTQHNTTTSDDASGGAPQKVAKRRAAEALAWEPLVGFVGISDSDRAAWRNAYPACDVEQQLARMHEWLKANPAKAKKSAWRKFIVHWLSRQQERGGDLRSNGRGSGGFGVGVRASTSAGPVVRTVN